MSRAQIRCVNSFVVHDVINGKDLFVFYMGAAALIRGLCPA